MCLLDCGREGQLLQALAAPFLPWCDGPHLNSVSRRKPFLPQVALVREFIIPTGKKTEIRGRESKAKERQVKTIQKLAALLKMLVWRCEQRSDGKDLVLPCSEQKEAFQELTPSWNVKAEKEPIEGRCWGKRVQGHENSSCRDPSRLSS